MALKPVPYQLPFLMGRLERVATDWIDWFRDLRTVVGALAAQVATVATGGAAWTDVAFNAALFTGAGGMTWTVGAPDVTSLTWKRDRTGDMTVAWYMGATSVGGVLSTALQIAIPDGKTAARTVLAALLHNDNGAGNVWGFAQVTAGGTTIDLYKISGAAWSAAVNTTAVFGQITFPTTT